MGEPPRKPRNPVRFSPSRGGRCTFRGPNLAAYRPRRILRPRANAMSDFVQSVQVQEDKTYLERLKNSVGQHIRGKDEVIDKVITCLIASGHVLIEDLPGVGKTTLAYCLSKSIDLAFNRIQFTSDLLPSDVTGVSIYDERTREFVFKPGPVFANIVLADEINRATPKTQSSLLRSEE